MIRLRNVRGLAVAITLALCGTSLLAQQHPNQQKGFNAGGVYQFNGIDTINAFNGNLILSIPLGNSYPIGGGLSYQLSLNSNANLWESEESGTYNPRRFIMYPHRRANAGIGWTVSLGRLYHPEHTAVRETNEWTYEGPDGADHGFAQLNPDGTRQTTDGSYLRMSSFTGNTSAECEGKPTPCDRRKVQLPSGEVHYFQPPDSANDHWALVRITNQFPGNWLKIIYTAPTTTGVGALSSWELADSHGRSQMVLFERMAYDGGPRDMVTGISLSAFCDEPGLCSERGEIAFQYEQRSLYRGKHHTDTVVLSTATVQVLKSVTLIDGSKFEFGYLTGSSIDTKAGLPYSMILPTGGEISWEWNTWERPADSPEGELNEVTAVWYRRLYGQPASIGAPRPLVGKWDYNFASACDPATIVGNQCGRYLYVPQTIKDPAGNTTINYFSVATFNESPWTQNEYGQPMSKHKSSGGRWLSSEVYAPTAVTLPSPAVTPLRSTYVSRVQHAPRYWSTSSSRIVFDDAEGAPYVDSDSSGWDGYGRYSTVTTSSSIASTPTRTTTTNYLPPTTTWIHGLYDWTTASESGQTLKSEFDFDSNTGSLRRQRAFRLLTGVQSPNDLISVFTSDPSSGNVTTEAYYGGDVQSVNMGTLPGLALPQQPEYKLTHGYTYGSRSYSAYQDSTGTEVLRTLSATIDQSTGLPRSTFDTSDLKTDYHYDHSGRLMSVEPAGSAKLTYEYTRATETAGASVLESTLALNSNVLKTSVYNYDALGRVVRESTSNPDTTMSRRDSTLDALGRKMTTTELGTAATLPFTKYELYDSFGRVGKVTAPDNSWSRLQYVGSHQVLRHVGAPAVIERLRSTEVYDGAGRLITVLEGSDNGNNIATTYGYDVGGHLRSVKMKSVGGVLQERTFDYDGRGFLRWESQPESGMTSYTYDSRGNVVSKDKSAAESQFDLRYRYDAAGRLVEVKGRNPFHASDPANQPEFRLLKEFQFASANQSIDRKKGKLEFANRYNYDAWDPNVPAYLIQDFYGYQDAAGRRTGRTTTIYRENGPVWTELKSVDMGTTYDDTGSPTRIYYPMCLDCGGPPVDPSRNAMTFSYSQGRLTGINGFVTGITYWPNGMRNVLVHSNNVADTQTVGNMARPTQISFGPYTGCVAPTILTQPAGSSVPSGGGSTTLSVTPDSSATTPLKYEWWNETDDEPAGTTQSISVTVTSTKSYRVTVSNPCGFLRSNSAKVTVGTCTPPATGTLTPVLQPDRSFILRPKPEARVGRTFKWKRMSDGVEWTTETLAVPAPTVAITYQFTVTDDCGSHTSSITLKPDLSITSTALLATMVSPTQISVQWPAVSGATSYSVERRSGAEWEVVGSSSSPSYVDNTVTASKTYAYRVSASGGGQQSGYSNSDVATTRTFIQAVVNTTITSAVSNQMLEAVNSVRAAAGWPPVTWSNILAATDPVPIPGNFVVARHVTSTRSRMNEALQALSVPVAAYPDPDLSATSIQAIHINSLTARAQ